MARVIFVLSCLMLSKGIQSNSLKLEQVLILSRHNIRTPFNHNLKIYSPKVWPKFKEPEAYLTDKGAILEAYMAQYISEWLAEEKFIKECPKQKDVIIYANTRPRTLATAKAFAEAAFKSCNISIHHYKDIDVIDPMFLSTFHNTTDYFKQRIIHEMEKKINETDLTESYLELNRILDIGHSVICQQKSVCDLSIGKSEVVYEEGQEPKVSGPLTIGSNIADSFIMSYYDGFPLQDVAWGQIKTDHQWQLMGQIKKQSQDVRFDFGSDSLDMSKPLVDYMFNIFKSGNPKFTVLVGHDSNLNSVLKALGFNKYVLPQQFEPYPIGGKLLFQKWSDGIKKYLKVEYVYSSTTQLRDAHKLSISNPPQRVLLELSNCKVDNNGFCPWEVFMTFIDNLLTMNTMLRY